MNSKILLVEDEENLGATLSEYLTSIGHITSWAKNVADANELFNNDQPEIVLMDIGLPDGSGLELAREFRKTGKDFVLLFLSALNDPEIKVEGLEIGADDYITKPFALKELTMRLDRIINFKKKDEQRDDLTYGKLTIRFKQFELIDANNNLIQLSKKECGILKLLYINKGKVISRDEIISDCWGKDQYPSNRTVDNYIVTLRKWCDTDSSKILQIMSIRGIGYKLIIKE
jgi:DNA-binding response OmpR family regulator